MQPYLRGPPYGWNLSEILLLPTKGSVGAHNLTWKSFHMVEVQDGLTVLYQSIEEIHLHYSSRTNQQHLGHRHQTGLHPGPLVPD